MAGALQVGRAIGTSANAARPSSGSVAGDDLSPSPPPAIDATPALTSESRTCEHKCGRWSG
jgi:hypothetical protein